jgi:hypothetical protein
MKQLQNDELLVKKLTLLLEAMEQAFPSTRQLIWRSFLRGIFIGLGTTLGASIVLAGITYILSEFGLAELIENLIETQ